ncbi:TPA: CocE/NonD family hydrolase, partial [Candidatus Micrarchaeota archaeon]|nr:CocE/NonD family hydrolase [Candidatus Micrarchaeota archaeon]
MKHLYEYITARDGIRLASDVYLPHPQGRFPTVVQRTPYGKYDQRCVAYAEWMAEHGYAAVIQDVRGRYDSDGLWHPYHNHEDTDGYDTVEWISTQAWSNGNVAFSGSSYLAFTGYMAAMGGHPALKALVARVPATGLYHHHFYMGGIFSLARVVWGTLVGRRVQQVSLQDGKPVFTFEKLIQEDPDLLLHLPVVEIGERFALPIPWWRTWLQHETEDQYWHKMEIIHHFNRIRIPIYHVGGWHDDFCSVSIE